MRHAPVRSDGGNIYGQKDIACDTSDREVFEAVAKILPRGAVWYASTLQRTHQTADAIWAAGFPKPASMPHEAAFAEQHLGQWQGMNRAAFLASRPIGSHWFADIDQPAPGGESFMDLYHRVCRAIDRINVEQAGKDVIAVAHGGTIKAAVGLALGGQPEKGLAFDIDNCSVTRLDHFASAGHSELAASDGQPAALDRGCQACRDASAGRAGSRAGDEARPEPVGCRTPRTLLSSKAKIKTISGRES